SENKDSDLAYLGQNYPNPFSENTNIAYSIYEDGQVLLSIYDVSGRRIQIIEDAYRARGKYTVSFNNSILEPGIYYYRLEVGASNKVFSETRKMIVH
ncbi:MAG: T9SS type A sorting domain-containing protein, partial [Bacteroidales bacterium]|nr:T9SS type A sorting domain-containing protein [Bacteroidales bacterium]